MSVAGYAGIPGLAIALIGVDQDALRRAFNVLANLVGNATLARANQSNLR
jgi:hypothetical protein